MERPNNTIKVVNRTAFPVFLVLGSVAAFCNIAFDLGVSWWLIIAITFAPYVVWMVVLGVFITIGVIILMMSLIFMTIGHFYGNARRYISRKRNK